MNHIEQETRCSLDGRLDGCLSIFPSESDVSALDMAVYSSQVSTKSSRNQKPITSRKCYSEFKIIILRGSSTHDVRIDFLFKQSKYKPPLNSLEFLRKKKKENTRHPGTFCIQVSVVIKFSFKAATVGI